MDAIKRYTEMINDELERLLPKLPEGKPVIGQPTDPLNEAMRYSLLSPGKRIRPCMLLAVVDMLGGDLTEALDVACAIEMLHAYSLVHDDLPGMDDDDLRRGLPTNHKVFGVGQAILAGDGLLNYSFEIMLNNALHYKEHLEWHVLAMGDIAHAAGITGMLAGQSMDLLSERKPEFGLQELTYIQHNKTAALIIGSLRAGARLCNADDVALNALSEYGRAFGMLFQTVDDLLDALGEEEIIGKSVGSDEQNDKLTAIKVYGLGGAQELKKQYLEEGLTALEPFSGKAELFRKWILETTFRKS